MNEQASLPLPGPRVSRVTIGRLYNLGNYEHVRLEVSVDMPPGSSPASVLGDLDALMAGMNPKAPHSDYAVGRAIYAMSKPAPKLEDFPVDDPDADPWDATRVQKLANALNEREDHARVIAETEQWRKARDAALRRFDELGGTARHGGAGYDNGSDA